MCTPSASTSPAATYSMTLVEQPHSGWIRKSAPGWAARTALMSSGLMPAWTWHSPSQHVQGPPGRLLDVGAQEHVRSEQDLDVVAVLGVDVLDDLHGVGRRAAVVGQRLDLGGRIDVHHHDRPGVLGLPTMQLRSGDRIGQRAAGVEIRDQHALLGAQDRGRLGHEVHAAEHDGLGPGLRRLLGEAQRVADVVGHVLDLGQLIVVGEDDGAPLGGQRAHLVLESRDVLE